MLQRYRDVHLLCPSCKGRGYSFETALEYNGGKAKATVYNGRRLYHIINIENDDFMDNKL